MNRPALNAWEPNMTAPLETVNPVLLLTPREAAAALAISERKLSSMTASRELPCLRIGRAVRYASDDLRAWIDRRRGFPNA